jgi:hypothetical protein
MASAKRWSETAPASQPAPAEHRDCLNVDEVKAGELSRRAQLASSTVPVGAVIGDRVREHARVEDDQARERSLAPFARARPTRQRVARSGPTPRRHLPLVIIQRQLESLGPRISGGRTLHDACGDRRASRCVDDGLASGRLPGPGAPTDSGRRERGSAARAIGSRARETEQALGRRLVARASRG